MAWASDTAICRLDSANLGQGLPSMQSHADYLHRVTPDENDLTSCYLDENMAFAYMQSNCITERFC